MSEDALSVGTDPLTLGRRRAQILDKLIGEAPLFDHGHNLLSGAAYGSISPHREHPKEKRTRCAAQPRHERSG